MRKSTESRLHQRIVKQSKGYFNPGQNEEERIIHENEERLSELVKREKELVDLIDISMKKLNELSTPEETKTVPMP